jgi:hypothetical protein
MHFLTVCNDDFASGTMMALYVVSRRFELRVTIVTAEHLATLFDRVG